MKMKLLSLGVALAIAVPGVVSAPNVANTSQKGSLLIFPRIDVRETGDTGNAPWNDVKTTIVRIVNDNLVGVRVNCYYMDWNKEKVDFHFNLTAEQPVWWDAATGRGSMNTRGFRTSMPGTGNANSSVNIIPDAVTQSTFPGHVGELKCWAVNATNSNQIRWNHLAGTATIYNFTDVTAAEYNAWSLYAHRDDTTPGGAKSIGDVPGELNLEGVDGTYDFCPEFLIGQMTPKGRGIGVDADGDGSITSAGETLRYDRTLLSVASCTQDLRQDWEWITTKLEFDTIDQDEIFLTGAYECSDSWHQVYLDDGDPGIASNGGTPLSNSPTLPTAMTSTDISDDYISFGGSSFLPADPLVTALYYRVHGVASSQCDETIRSNSGDTVIRVQETENVGLVGVQLSEITATNQAGQGTDRMDTATTPHAAGTRTGQILWDTESDTIGEKN